MEKSLKLYSFESAIIEITPAAIIPPIFKVTVKGIMGSLNAEIELVNTGEIKDGYLVLEVLGRDGIAIGSMEYVRTINVSQDVNIKGVVVKGANKKSVKLNWSAGQNLSKSDAVGLFHLSLETESKLNGAPELHLQLLVDSVSENVTGSAIVKQAVAESVVCNSHVTGNIIYETVMKPGTSCVRIFLSGYPVIHWPKGGGVGPVILKNFKAMVYFDSDWKNGVVNYQYTGASGWICEEQHIEVINGVAQTKASKKASSKQVAYN